MKLRPFQAGDEATVARLLNSTSVTRHLSTRIPSPYTLDDARWWVNTGSKEGITRAIIVNQQVVGSIGADVGAFEEYRSAEVGYWLGQTFWGLGYATEALGLLTDIVFSQTNIVRLYAYVYEPNIASMRVLEKCGYQFEGVLRKACYKNGQFCDKHIFANIR